MPTPRTPLPRAALSAVGEAEKAIEEAAQQLRALLRREPTNAELASALTHLARAQTRCGEARQVTKGGGGAATAPMVTRDHRRPRTQGGPMLNRTQEERLKVSLTEAMSRWLEQVGESGDIALPYLGENMAETMAAAAFAPMRAVADAQDYLSAQDMLKDD